MTNPKSKIQNPKWAKAAPPRSKAAINRRNPRNAQARTLKLRKGFTLVEVLIAAALSLVVIGLVVQVFAMVGNTATETRAVVQMTDRIRSARIVIARDLANITVDFTKVPLKPELGQGYLEYLEGPDGPIFPGLSGVPVAVDINQTGTPADSTVGDPDDVLMFTANAPSGTFFYGRMRAGSTVVDASGRVWPVPVDTTAQASSAEICYFMRGTTLYRRVLLIMPASTWSATGNQIDPTIYLSSLYPTFINSGTTSLPQPNWDIAFYDKFDLSARQTGGSFDISNSLGGLKSPMLVPNALGDLTARQNRYGHQPWVYPFDARFWDERNWVVPATYQPVGGFLGLPTLRECSAYTASLTSVNGVARWPFPLFELGPNPLPLPPIPVTYLSGAAVVPPVTVSGNANVASANLWGVPYSYQKSLTVAAGVSTPVFPYYNSATDLGLPLIYPYPSAATVPAGTTVANFQPATTIPAGAWTGRINLTNTVNGGLFDLWSNPYPLDQQDFTAAPRTGALYAFSSAFQPMGEVNVNYSTRYADDILMTHVLSFDVKAWDPTAPTIQTNATIGGIPPGTYMPGDPGYVQIISAWASNGTLLANLQPGLYGAAMTASQPPGSQGGYGFTVAQGAYVDLNYLGPVIGTYLASNTQMAQALANVSTFAGPGMAQFGSTFSTGSGLAMLYDTGCQNYENDGIDQNQNGIIDDFTNGLDDNGIGGPDDHTEMEASMPYPVPLKGIQIKIRVFDPDSRQIREVTLTQDFL